MNAMIRSGWILVVGLGICISGCAPRGFPQMLAQTIEHDRVTNAAARANRTYWYLRFDIPLLSDLDDAIAGQDPAEMRQQGRTVFEAAAALARRATHNEIERLSPDARAHLADQTGGAATTAAIEQRFDEAATAALAADLQQIDTLEARRLRAMLTRCRRGMRPLPDDRDRLGRQLTLAWAALPTWVGLTIEEDKLAAKAVAKASKQVERVALWRPAAGDGSSLLARFAPLIAVEWPAQRAYPEADDRIGRVRLAPDGEAIAVSIDPAEPRVYAFTSTAKVGGRRYRQLVYVWWLPERPAMEPRDPAAGHVDGGTLRITLDDNDRPIIAETVLNCGCGHQVFVSQALEDAAQRAFGQPLKGKRFAIEKNVPGKRDLIIITTFAAAAGPPRPAVYIAAGYHEVFRFTLADPADVDGLRIVAQPDYALGDYDELTALPLGDGLGSMFGPDGLVHNAGRPEGYLLAPTGILSAGQPRQRGTQRIRWDDYLFDEPRLLERTLRLPPEMYGSK